MKKTIIALSTLSIFFAACGGGNKTKDEAASGDAGVYTATHPGLLHDQKAIDNVFTELRNMEKFKGKKINVFQDIDFHDYGRIDLKISDPAKPTNVDKYVFADGKWRTPEPVQIDGTPESMNDNVTDLDKIAVNKIADMAKIVDEKAKTIEGAKPCESIYFNFMVETQTRVFRASADGTREKADLVFTSDGVLKK